MKTRFRARLGAFAKGTGGAAAIEYGLIAALIAVVVIAVVSAVGPEPDDSADGAGEPPPAAADGE